MTFLRSRCQQVHLPAPLVIRLHRTSTYTKVSVKWERMYIFHVYGGEHP